MYAHTRAMQVEPMRYARRCVVLLVRGHGVEGTKAFDRAAVMLHVLGVVAVVHHPREDADRPRVRLWIAGRVLQSQPRQLEQLPLLRIRHLRLTRRNPEQLVVEQVGARDDAARGHIGRIFTHLARNAWIECMGREEGYSLDTLLENTRQRFDARGSGETPRPAHDGYRLELPVAHPATPHLRRSQVVLFPGLAGQQLCQGPGRGAVEELRNSRLVSGPLRELAHELQRQ